MALDLALPIRLVRGRIRFEDQARQPYTPPAPDTHHRNETLLHMGDPRVGLQLMRVWAPWTTTASLGVSVPLGRTESNPFALGRLGRQHQHLQFGTGTLDPYVGVAASRRFGRYHLALDGSLRHTLHTNSKGYRAGDRASASSSLARAWGSGWGGRAGLDLTHESAEQWDGVVEEEGNLGRTDLYLMLGVARRADGLGTLGMTIRTSLVSQARGAQASLPLVLQVSLTR